MVFTNEEQEVPICGNGGAQFGQVRINIDTEVLYFEDGRSGDDIVFLRFKITGGVA